MSESYVPTTGQVRIAYSIIDGDASTSIIEQRKLAFDRWLVQHDREVKAEVWDEGWKARSERPHLKRGECVPAPDHINPYRIESQETP